MLVFDQDKSLNLAEELSRVRRKVDAKFHYFLNLQTDVFHYDKFNLSKLASNLDSVGIEKKFIIASYVKQ